MYIYWCGDVRGVWIEDMNKCVFLQCVAVCELKQHIASVRLDNIMRNVHLKINISKSRAVKLARQNGVNDCKLYVNSRNLEQNVCTLEEWVLKMEKLQGKL